MNGRLIFKDCTLLHADGRLEPGMAVSVEGRYIAALGPDADFPLLPGDWWVDCGGRVLAPGLIDCHTPLPLGASRLGDAAVEALTAHALAEGLLRGVTTRVLQLHAERDCSSRLEAQGRAAASVGARAVFSVAPREADGVEVALEQLEAAAAFADRLEAHPHQRALPGWCGPAPRDAEFHSRVSAAFEAAGGVAVLDRTGTHQGDSRIGSEVMRAPDWLDLQAIVVGGARLTADARTRLFDAGALLALGPHDGSAPALFEEGARLGLHGGSLESGLAHATWCLLASVRTAELPAPRIAQVLAAAQVQGPAAWMSLRFGADLGELSSGASADLVLYDWVPQTQGRGALDLLRDRMEARVWWTVVDGRVVVREGALLGPDGGDLARVAASTRATLDGAAA